MENQNPNDTSDNKVLRDQTMRRNDNLEEKNNFMKYILAATGVILLAVILLFSLSGETDYEKGMKYLQQKQYSEALFEFQKVEPDDKEFRMAQSKINYIKGLETFEKGTKSESLVYLAKVDASDEYYRESRLMIDKINMADKQANLEALSEQINKVKDTVIIREQIPVETPSDVSKDTEAGSAADKNTALILAQSQRQIAQFEDQYQLAKDAAGDTKKSYLNKMDSILNVFSKSNISKEKDSKLSQIYILTTSWMQKRIDHVNELISSNSGSETKSSLITKQDGDKVYQTLLRLIKS